jgi:hypothetical protein
MTMGASAMLSYDAGQIEAAVRSGLDTLSPI